MAKAFISTEADVSEPQMAAIPLRQFAAYVLCATLGLLSGAVSVALAIGLAILVQSLLPPSVAFSPGTIPLLVAAALLGLGVAWLLGQAVRRLMPGVLSSSGEKGLQVVLVFSIFASLLQTLIFFARV